MEWLVALLILAAALLVLPVMVRRTGRSVRGKGGTGAVMMGIGLAFAAIFDPPARAATEEIDRNRESRRQEDAAGSE